MNDKNTVSRKSTIVILACELFVIIISAWMSIFLYYWTIDVKGYFKECDVFYGSIILFVGFFQATLVIWAYDAFKPKIK